MIVIVSHPNDAHAAAVQNLLAAAGRPFELLDLSDLPAGAELTVEIDGGPEVRPIVHHHTQGEIDLSSARSVWWRRPQAPLTAGLATPEHEVFAHGEWAEMLGGLWGLLPVRWMNDPVKDAAASRKLLQLRRAAAAGLRIPDTLATTNPDEARNFIERHGVGKTIAKTFLCTYDVWRHTMPVGPDDLGQLDRLRVCPTIFQPYIEGVDLRVTVVGRRIFAMEIDASQTASPFDFRPVLGESTVRPVALPAAVESALLALMADLGLEYGAVDFRRTPAGEHVFLEVNTAGEFLFAEQMAGLPISQAIADHLAWVPQSPKPG